MTEKIKKRIREIAKDEGINPELAVKVAECESSFKPLITGWNKNGTFDRGLYQWNNYWHPEISDKCAFDIDCSTRAFCKAVRGRHLNWWNASKKCWRSAYRKSLLIRIRDILRKLVSLYRQLLEKYFVRKNQS